MLFICPIFGQINKLDSIKEKIISFKNTNPDSALFYAKKLKLSNNKCYVIDGISSEAYFYYSKKDFANSLKVAKNLYAYSDSLIKNNKIVTSCFYDGKIAALNRIFWIYKNQENYKEAYKVLSEIEETRKNYPDKNNRKIILSELTFINAKAVIKNSLKLENDALVVLKEAVKKINSNVYVNFENDNTYLQHKANIFNNLGDTYLKLSKKNITNTTYLDSAYYYYKRAYKVTQLFNPQHLDSEIIYSFRETEVLIAKNNFEKAIELINNYKNISNGYFYKHREVFQKAICYSNLQKTDSAIYYAYKLLNDKKDRCKRSNLITMYDILSKQYYKLNKIDSAYKYSQKTINQFNIANKNKEETFQLLYKNDFNNAQKLNEELTKKHDSKNYLFSGILFLSIASLSIGFLFFYKQQKAKQLLLTNNNVIEESSKKEYNIDKDLEAKILEKINNIDANLTYLKPDFSITYLADKLNTNSTYISFVFNNAKGETFKQYYTRLKIEYIKNKLISDKKYRNYSIKALAEEIGYSNASAFSRAFKKQTGVTPSDFIKSI